MNFTWQAVIFASVVVSVSATSSKVNSNPNEDIEDVKDVNEDGNRDKRGFILTPLSALPAEAIAPLLPYLRAVVPAPILAKISPLLPSAAVVDASAPSKPLLPGLLTATAPLVNNRLVKAQSAEEIQSSTPQPPVVVAQRVPQVTLTPHKIPATAFAFTTPILSAPLISQPIATNFAVSYPTATVNKAQVLPQAIPTVPRPTTFASNYVAFPTFPAQSNFASLPLTAFPSTQFFGRSVFV